MDKININKILNREKIAEQITTLLASFENNVNNKTKKNGIYIFGQPGSGKTSFIIKLLNDLNYDVIKFDAGDIRNASVIEDITKHNMSNQNVLSMFNKIIKKKVIVMDEIDGMNNGDKGGINSLIKLIRPKKTKKQQKENYSLNPIICISNYKVDKKIKELIKVCNSFELTTPTDDQMSIIINLLLPTQSVIVKQQIITFVQGDLRRLISMQNIITANPKFFENIKFDKVFQPKNYNDDTKKTTKLLFVKKYLLEDHGNVVNETDRTSVGLLWHENIIDIIQEKDKHVSIPFYLEQLNNICFADYIDRITFQNQIWQFNEMSSLIKTFYNNHLLHAFLENNKPVVSDIRFTKVLTKYSTEYNNVQFIQKLCQKLALDKSDLIGYFNQLKSIMTEPEIYSFLEKYEINKLEINRIYRYIEKYTKENAIGTTETPIDQYDDDNDSEFEEV
jgi:DNA polymerase III delta prime subunit